MANVKKHKVELLNTIVLTLMVVLISLLLLDYKEDNHVPVVRQEKVSIAPEVLSKFDLVGDGFHLLYEELAMPNTLHLVSLPGITGDTEADAHIREIAKRRGYRQRRVAQLEEELVQVSDSEFIQARAIDDYLKLARAAEAEGIELRVRSGYRAIDDQREIFVYRLNELGIGIDLIVGGSQDIALNELLRTTAPPGYSRHHTGYTLDLASDTVPFEFSAGFRWLAQENYKNTLEYGFIPSYPEDAFQQGPDPEAWEFVWVGTNLIEAQVE